MRNPSARRRRPPKPEAHTYQTKLTKESYLRSEWGIREVLGPSPVHAVLLHVTPLDIIE